MKKLTALLMSMMLMLTATACTTGNTEAGGSTIGNEPPVQPSTSEPTPPSTSASSSSESGTSEGPVSQENDGTLVIYFSATGNTKAVAEAIAKTAGGNLYEIVPKEPYTADDLNWNKEDSRASVEHNDPEFRPAIAGELPDLSGYQTIFIGYPIWWGEAPNIVRTLVESIDLTGKTVIPFATSSSSSFGSSGETLAALTTGATWLEGQRFRGGADEAEITEWVNGLDT